MFGILDSLAGANWQRSGRKSGKPKPLSPSNPKSPFYRGSSKSARGTRRPPTDEELAVMIAELEKSAPKRTTMGEAPL